MSAEKFRRAATPSGARLAEIQDRWERVLTAHVQGCRGYADPVPECDRCTLAYLLDLVTYLTSLVRDPKPLSGAPQRGVAGIRCEQPNRREGA